MFTIRLRSHLRFLLLALAILCLLLLPLFLLSTENQGRLSSFLFPASLEQTLLYDEEGNLIHVETIRATGSEVALESLQECAQGETLDPEIQQAFQEGETTVRHTKQCK